MTSPGTVSLPLWWSRDFPGQLSQASQVRSWVAGLLPECAPREDLLLVATELASNAVRHTRSGDPGGQFTVKLTWSPETARVIVGDQGAREVPVNIASPADQGVEAESGRGLLLVEALSLAWGLAADADAGWAWADVAWEPAGGLPLPVPAGTGDPRQEGHLLPTRNPLSDYPATHLDALGRSVLALLSFQDMLPTDLYVKLDLLREDISAAINSPRRTRRSTPHTAASGRRPPRDHSTT